MRTALLLCVLPVALAAVFHNPANLPAHDGKYTVVFHDHSTVEMRTSFVNKWNARKRSDSSIGDFVHHNIDAFNALSGRFDESHIEELLKEESINYIEPNFRVTMTNCLKGKAPWGVERINNRTRPNRYSGTFTYSDSADGHNVDAYIIDTGIDIKHPELGNRAIWGTNTVDRTNSDCQGHGTHVAGTVGSATYGIARKVQLIAVKTLDCRGSGDSQSILQAVAWVVEEMRKRKRPAVANMSLGGPYSRAENDVIARAIKAGVVMVIAAGNENSDACETSPASTAEAITVGASDIDDRFAEFSNYGRCVDLIAPGVDITSLEPGGGLADQSGTSMASPHVAGVVALILSQNPTWSPADVANYLERDSTVNVIRGTLRSTPNKFLHAPCAINSTVPTTPVPPPPPVPTEEPEPTRRPRPTRSSGFTSGGFTSGGFTSGGFTSGGFTTDGGSGRTTNGGGGRTTTTTTTTTSGKSTYTYSITSGFLPTHATRTRNQ